MAAPEVPAQDTDVFARTRQFAAEGATELALARTERLQPPPEDRGRWAQWEGLRLELLERLGRNREIAERAARLSEDAPPELAQPALLAGAKAALKVGNPALARILLARLLWREGGTGEGERAVRLLVTDTYIEQKRPADAYQAMLRFQQDFQPLTKGEGEKFARGLARLDAYREAATWLAYLDEADSERLLIQLETGLVSPDTAVARARASLKKSPSAGAWRVLAQAAARKADAGLALEAAEQLLNQPADPPPERAAAAALWDRYLAFGEEVANREHLLRGDDGAWLALAERLQAATPHSARAVLATLSLKAGSADARRGAEEQLLGSLIRQRLAVAAARLASGSGRYRISSLDAEIRQALGVAAQESGDAALAVELWRGLPVPEGQRPEAWRLRYAAAALKAGSVPEADQAVRAILAPDQRPGRDVQQRILALAADAAAQRQPQAAAAWLAALVPLAEAALRRDAWLGLGRLAEGRGENGPAAEFYLEAASAGDTRSADAVTVDARLRAARALAAAGMRRDARAQLEWVARHARDKALQDLARRELDRL
ncbi:MAG TPA: hypothetical protein VF104_05790 [Burkholderiales bacterium]